MLPCHRGQELQILNLRIQWQLHVTATSSSRKEANGPFSHMECIKKKVSTRNKPQLAHS